MEEQNVFLLAYQYEVEKDDSIILLALMITALVLILFGLLVVATQTYVPTDRGSGELSIDVTDQNGETLSGESVQILDQETGEVLAEGVTDDDGEVEFNLEQGEYDVNVGDKVTSVTLGEETEQSVQVDRAPPELSVGTNGD